MNREDTNHVSNTNHLSVVESSGHLPGIVIGVLILDPHILKFYDPQISYLKSGSDSLV